MKRIECIIMDWAGSAVDYGCFAPVAAFLKAFNEIGINITMEQARRPMGMAKIDHIRELFKMDGVGEEFEKLYHRPWNEQDVTDMNAKFEEYLFASLANYTDPIPGVIDTLNELRKQGIKIGSTTGYTQAHDGRSAPQCSLQRVHHRQVCHSQRPACRTSFPLYDLPKHDRSCHPFNRLCSEVR